MLGIHLGCLYLYDTDAITHQTYHNYKSQPVITHKSPILFSHYFFSSFFLFQKYLYREEGKSEGNNFF